MQMPNRKYTQPNSSYRYGFNGKENDKDISEGGQDYGMRIYDSRMGRFLSVDPLTKSYPWNSTYAFAENRVIDGIDLEGKERYFTADGKLLGKYGTSKEMRIVKQNFVDALKKTNVNIIATISKPPNQNFIKNLNDNSQIAYLNTDANQNKVLSSWANQNRTTEREKVMSLFISKIDNPDGKGKIDVFVEGSTGSGPKYEGRGANVSPFTSTTTFSNWTRSTTIHTHPTGDPLNFSNELAGFMSGGDLQFAVSNNADLYLVPPGGNEMGKFSVSKYKELVRASLVKYDTKDGYYKNMPDSKMFDDGSVGDPIGNKTEAKRAMQKVEINKPK